MDAATALTCWPDLASDACGAAARGRDAAERLERALDHYAGLATCVDPAAPPVVRPPGTALGASRPARPVPQPPARLPGATAAAMRGPPQAATPAAPAAPAAPALPAAHDDETSPSDADTLPSAWTTASGPRLTDDACAQSGRRGVGAVQLSDTDAAVALKRLRADSASTSAELGRWSGLQAAIEADGLLAPEMARRVRCAHLGPPALQALAGQAAVKGSYVALHGILAGSDDAAPVWGTALSRLLARARYAPDARDTLGQLVREHRPALCAGLAAAGYLALEVAAEVGHARSFRPMFACVANTIPRDAVATLVATAHRYHWPRIADVIAEGVATRPDSAVRRAARLPGARGSGSPSFPDRTGVHSLLRAAGRGPKSVRRALRASGSSADREALVRRELGAALARAALCGRADVVAQLFAEPGARRCRDALAHDGHVELRNTALCALLSGGLAIFARLVDASSHPRWLLVLSHAAREVGHPEAIALVDATREIAANDVALLTSLGQ